MEDYYSSYKEFRQEIDDACDCIHSYKCGTLNSEIVDIKNLISGLNVSDNWQDSVGDGISTIISACIDSLDDIIASITSSFETSESLYLELQRQLMNLETFNNDYQKRYGEKPDESDYHHTELVKGISYYLFGTKEYEDVFDKKKYEAALEKWEGDVERYSGLCEDLIEAIEANKRELKAINDSTISSSNISSLSSINVGSILHFLALPTDARKEFILSNFGTTDNPFLSRFAQNQYDNISIGGGGRNIHTSGCGICANASALSCALSTAYGSYVSIDPGQLLDALERGTGHKRRGYFNDNYDYAWNSFDDTTAVFPDVTVIKLSESGRTFTDQTLKQVTDAGGTAVVSLSGRGHVVAVTQADASGKFKVADSGSRHYDTTTVSVSDPIYSSSKRTSGTISGKNGAIYMPNNRLSINTETGVVEGIDATGLNVDSISIAGRSYKASVSNGRIVIENPQSLVPNLPSSNETVSI